VHCSSSNYGEELSHTSAESSKAKPVLQVQFQNPQQDCHSEARISREESAVSLLAAKQIPRR
jgi:hypothetical protein